MNNVSIDVYTVGNKSSYSIRVKLVGTIGIWVKNYYSDCILNKLRFAVKVLGKFDKKYFKLFLAQISKSGCL